MYAMFCAWRKKRSLEGVQGCRDTGAVTLAVGIAEGTLRVSRRLGAGAVPKPKLASSALVWTRQTLHSVLFARRLACVTLVGQGIKFRSFTNISMSSGAKRLLAGLVMT